jgi:hypothetical protein
MGKKRTAPASMTASCKLSPSPSRASMKSINSTLFLTMIPARAMTPIMEVAVKKAPMAQWAGNMPMREKGMATMITMGVENDWNQPTTKTKISTSTTAKQCPCRGTPRR